MGRSRRRKYNVVDKDTKELLECTICRCKTFMRLNNKGIKCAYCGTSYKVTWKDLDTINLIHNSLGRFPYNK